MSDELTSVLRLAIQSAGDVEDYIDWRKRVLERATAIAGMLNEHSLEWHVTKRVLDGAVKDSNTSVFLAIYRGYTVDTRSTRLRVHLADPVTGEHDKDLQTDRTDELMGQVMRARLDGIKPGTKVRAWKNLESFGTKADPKRFRVLAHIEPMSKRDDDPASSAPTPPGAAAAADDPRSAAAPPRENSGESSRGSQLAAPSVKEALARLTGAQKVRVAQAAAKANILDIQNPTPEQADRLLVIIEENLT